MYTFSRCGIVENVIPVFNSQGHETTEQVLLDVVGIFGFVLFCASCRIKGVGTLEPLCQSGFGILGVKNDPCSPEPTSKSWTSSDTHLIPQDICFLLALATQNFEINDRRLLLLRK